MINLKESTSYERVGEIGELIINSYKGYQLSVKTPRKQRSDRKYAVKAMLTKHEKRILNTAILELGYKTVLHFVSASVSNGVDLAITDLEIESAKRRIRGGDREGIQVCGKINAEVYAKFQVAQASHNLNQRQLVYVLINKAITMAGYRWS